ncbi:MAG: hypothetical protein ACR2RV_01245 [Verrucomicrobiales bacterium]
MANRTPDDTPLQELKHEAVPGYLRAFTIAFAVMGVYLAIILISSPGPAEKHDKPGAHATAAEPEAS